MRNLWILALMAGPAAAQPLDISASAAVTWISWEGARAPTVEPGDPSLGYVAHPALVVVWRGQPGWTFRGGGDTSSVEFAGGGERTFDGGVELRSVVSHGNLTLEAAFAPETRVARVNGVSVQMPFGHNVVLVDNADTEAPSIETLGIEPEGPEPVETFLGRSVAVREFARCAVRLPETLPQLPAGVDPAAVRDMFQRMLDERCALLAGR